MNTKLLRHLLGSMVVLVLAGCESARYEPGNTAVGSVPPVFPAYPQPAAAQILARAAAQPIPPLDGAGWRDLFDGRSLAGWRQTDFQEGGGVTVTNGLMLFAPGNPFVGVNCTAEIPRINYEVALAATRVSGEDFFCGLTFPVRDSYCSLIVGGWGGTVVGLSNLDGSDASENETTQFITFESGRWYRIRLRVTEQKLEAWIEQKKVVDINISGRKLSLRFGEIEMSKPFGLASYNTGAAFRELKLRPVFPTNAPAGN